MEGGFTGSDIIEPPPPGMAPHKDNTPQGWHPPGQTDASENITLPQTTFAGGNNK